MTEQTEIHDLVAELARLCDEGSPDEVVAVFTADAAWEMGGATIRGTDGLREMFQGMRDRRSSGPGTGVRHIVTNVVVELAGDGVSARGRAYWLLVAADADGVPTIRRAGDYADEFRREPDGWRFSRRTVRVLGPEV